jgi:hypothetical protein
MLAVITLGGSVFLALSQGEEVKAKVAWNPKRYTLDTAVPDPWNAEIWLTKGHKREEINTTTILLEGIYKPSADPYPAERGPRLIVPFSGEEVLTALLTKLPHMTSGRHRIPLEITGLLLDGTPFRGVGYIKLTVP